MQLKNGDTEKSFGLYPYAPIAICLPIAEAVKSLGGSNSPVSKASLASFLKEDEKSTGLATKIASAKAFGMIEGRSSFKLTESATRFFSSTGSAHRSALLDFLESPIAFKKLIERFDGSILPPAEALGTMLHNDSAVPKSWKDRVAGFFIRSAKYAGAIDDKGHLRFKASREMRIENAPKAVDNDAMHAKIQPPEFGRETPQSPIENDALETKLRGKRMNAAPMSFTISETDKSTGEKRVVFAEVPSDLGFSAWKILEQWVQSIKPKEKPE